MDHNSRRPHQQPPHHSSYAAPPPGPSTIDQQRQHPSVQHPPPPYAQPPPQQQHPAPAPPPPPYSGPPPQHPGGPALPPIQHHQAYGPPGSAADQLPSFRHPPPSHEGQDQFQYPQHPRSGHATPVPVNRTYSHDSAPQPPPTTPAPFPSISAPDAGPGAAQQPHPMEHGHPGYAPANGLGHALPPPQQPPHAHHEPHPSHMTPVMENHYGAYSAPPPAPQSMYQQTYGGPMQGGQQYQMQRKKQMRATQACEQCRARKQKCDEGNPCSFCKENSLTCQYRDTPPAKTDKNMEKLLDYMKAHAAGLSELNNKVERLDDRLRKLEQINAPVVSAPQMPIVMESEPSLQDHPVKRKVELKDHRTAPHKLLMLWPSVSTLLKAADVNLSEGYVMEAEDRGILRLYTRGEGIDEHDGTQPGGPASPAISDESGGEVNAPTPPEGLWGCGFPQTPQSEVRRSEPSWGGLKPDNSLDLDVYTLNALYDSYMKNIHVMHPFLDKARLRKLFDNFIKRYSPGQQKLRSTFAVGQNSDGERPLKRQRSNGSTVLTHSSGGETFRSQSTERSPGNAIVYLVLALGRICMHKEPLPAVVPDNRLNANSVVTHQMSGNGPVGSSPVSASMKPSQMSPGEAFLSKSTPATQPTPPAEGTMLHHQSRSRRSSVDGFPAAGLRNLDVIPGLAYFAKACEILGDQGDGNDLVHAQMFLLAGIYKGQLARVKESMSWITMAGRAISNLLDRYKLYNDEYWNAYGDVRRRLEANHSRIKDKRSDLIVLASWTCLQLESDILAELRLPASGILDMESMLLLPHNVSEEESYDGLDQKAHQDEYDNIMLYYNAQMFLRKRLNQVHREMYGQDSLQESLESVREMLRGHESVLNEWRAKTPPKMKWEDTDEPASDILNARLRAKYWGARYVVNRPFLDYALHILPHVEDKKKVADVAKDVHGNPRDKAEIHLFEAIECMGHPTIWLAAQRCIQAAMYSTVALDGVADRLVVTNIHGTAHAQFGNMLVLSATYYSDALKGLIDVEHFRRLLDRTIRFLRKLAPISPTCAIDCSILEKIQKKLFGLPPDEKNVYNNEGYTDPISATNSFSAST